MTKIGQYHLMAPHRDSWKLIQHIRFLINEGALKQISHEGTESGKTFVCIILKSRVSLSKFMLIERNLAGLGLEMI